MENQINYISKTGEEISVKFKTPGVFVHEPPRIYKQTISEERSKSDYLRYKLECEIIELINNIEQNESYIFESFEINDVLLNIIQNNQKQQIRTKYGNGYNE